MPFLLYPAHSFSCFVLFIPYLSPSVYLKLHRIIHHIDKLKHFTPSSPQFLPAHYIKVLLCLYF